MLICWYCDYPIDVDESIEGHAEIHKDCLLELATNGAFDAFVQRAERLKREHAAAIDKLNTAVAQRETAILATT